MSYIALHKWLTEATGPSTVEMRKRAMTPDPVTREEDLKRE